LSPQQQWQVRQMAAVELRKRAGKWWSQIDTQTTEAIKKQLVDFVLAEQEYVFRRAYICYVLLISEYSLLVFPGKNAGVFNS
jgi:hypothetical protein